MASELGLGIVVNLQVDEPLIDPDTVAAVVQPVRDGTAPMATAMTGLSADDRKGLPGLPGSDTGT